MFFHVHLIQHLILFFSNLQSTRDSHVCRACISLKKGVYSHLPSNRCNSILYHLLVCPKLASQFQNSRVAQARTCSGKQRSSSRNIRTSKIAKDPARTTQPMMSLAVFWLRTRCIVSLEGFPTSGIPASNRVVHRGITHTQSARLALHIDPTIAILRSADRSEDRSSERSSDSMPSFADYSDYYPYNVRPPR